jgi:hypothetical protein
MKQCCALEWPTFIERVVSLFEVYFVFCGEHRFTLAAVQQVLRRCGYLGAKGTNRGTSLIRNTPLIGPYLMTIQGPIEVLCGGLFLMSEVPL